MPTSVPVSTSLDRLAVEDAMHPGLIGCDPNARLATVAWILGDEHIHAVMVDGRADGDRGAWGIVTAPDVIRALHVGDWSVTARHLAAADFVTVTPAARLDRVVRLMSEHEVTHVLVVENGAPVGIVSALDVVRAAGRPGDVHDA